MSNNIKAFNRHTDYINFRLSINFETPNVSYCKDTKDVHYNPISYDDQYFTIEALKPGKVGFAYSVETAEAQGVDVDYMDYSLDNGVTWNRINCQYVKDLYDNDTDPMIILDVEQGDRILWKGYNETLLGATFASTERVNIFGNTMSLLYDDDFKGQTILPDVSTSFLGVFSNVNISIPGFNTIGAPFSTTRGFGVRPSDDDINPSDPPEYEPNPYPSMVSLTSLLKVNYAHNLILPARTVYANIFDDNDPSYIVGTYSGMFARNTIVTAPELPATTLAEHCYAMMFLSCVFLKRGPHILPATTLAKACYSLMFAGCETLEFAPELPATTLASSCYEQMFSHAYSILKIELPATTFGLNTLCYNNMLNNCVGLKYVKALFEDDSSTCIHNINDEWMKNVYPTGKFVMNSNARYDIDDLVNQDYIPNTWTIEEE